jgi:hypothetical protein
MSIPELDPVSGNLPPGDHPATVDEVGVRFGFNYRRKELLRNVEWVVEKLWASGVTEIYIDGGFVTAKERTRDVDMVYVAPPGAEPETWGLLAPSRRLELKKLHRIDLWRFPSPQLVGGAVRKTVTIKAFFESDRDGNAKGIVKLIPGRDRGKT